MEATGLRPRRKRPLGQRIVIGVILIVLLLAAYIWATTPTGHSLDHGPDRIVQWTGGGHFEPDSSDPRLDVNGRAVSYELLGTRAKKNRITHWKFRQRFIAGSHKKSRGATAVGCGKAISDSFGENGIGWTVVEGHVSISWCWEGAGYDGTKADIVGKIHVNAWGSTAGWSLWSYDGVDPMVMGSGTACSDVMCWEYAYRRAYFRYSRGVTNGLSQHTETWAAVTVRGIGTWEVDHYKG